MKILLTCILLVLMFLNIKAQVAINLSGATANTSSMLDVSSTSKGILIPRMSNAERYAIINPATGLLVFQNSPDSVGFHYYNGAKWVYIISSNSVDTTAWLTKGNLGTDTAKNFIGTTDNMPLKFKQNNSQIGFWNKNVGSYFLGSQAGLVNGGAVNNIAIGDNGLLNNNLGTNNIAFGNSALKKNKTGNFNVAFGSFALSNKLKGDNNLSVGNNASFLDTSGSQNISIGLESAYFNFNGYSNILIGSRAGFSNSKSNILAIGDSALYNNGIGATTPDHSTGNVALGSKALYSNNQGYNHTAIGFNALYNTVGTSNNNTAIGYKALQSLTTSSNNTGIGSEAGLSLGNSASENVAIGSDALRNGTNPEYATAIGAQALKEQSTSGTAVTGIGFKAGASYSNEDSSTFIGAYSDAAFTSLKNATAIGSGAIVAVNNGMVFGKTNVRVGIGTSYPPTNNKVTIKGLGNTNATKAFQVVNSDSTRVFEVSDSDSVKIGSVGTFIKGIIKVKITNYDLPSISASNTETVTFTVNGALANAGAVAYMSPVGALISGLVIASVRVSSNNSVEVKFTNTFGLARDQGVTDYNIVVIQ